MVCRSEEGQGALARCRAFQRRSVLAASWLPTQTKTLRTIQYFYSASSVLLQYWRVEWRPGKSFTKWPTAHYGTGDGSKLSGSIWQMWDRHAKGLPAPRFHCPSQIVFRSNWRVLKNFSQKKKLGINREKGSPKRLLLDLLDYGCHHPAGRQWSGAYRQFAEWTCFCCPQTAQ